jgi:hypothetical protein
MKPQDELLKSVTKSYTSKMKTILITGIHKAVEIDSFT